MVQPLMFLGQCCMCAFHDALLSCRLGAGLRVAGSRPLSPLSLLAKYQDWKSAPTFEEQRGGGQNAFVGLFLEIICRCWPFSVLPILQSHVCLDLIFVTLSCVPRGGWMLTSLISGLWPSLTLWLIYQGIPQFPALRS